MAPAGTVIAYMCPIEPSPTKAAIGGQSQAPTGAGFLPKRGVEAFGFFVLRASNPGFHEVLSFDFLRTREISIVN